MLEDQVKKLKNASLEEKREIVSNFGIYELRGLARALGVSSPTTKKRDFLVDAILNLLMNENLEIVQKASKGRPFKKLETIDNIINLINESDIKMPPVPKTYSYEDIISFAQEIPVFEYQSKDLLKKQGVLRLLKNVSYFMDLKDNLVVFVSSDLISKYNLQNGDLLEVSAYKINTNNQYSAKDIINVNGESASSCKFQTYQASKVLPVLKKYINNKSIIIGGRNISIIEDPLFLEADTIKVIKSFSSEENYNIFIGLNLSLEDRLLLEECPEFTKFISEYGKDNCSKNFDKIIDAINLCERLCSIGKNVVFVVYDILNLLNALDVYFSNSDAVQMMGHCQQSNIIIEKLISLASAYSTGKDCTEIIICNQLDLNDSFIRNQVLKVSRVIK